VQYDISFLTKQRSAEGGETPFLKIRNKRQKRLVGIYVGKWVGGCYSDVDSETSLLVYYVVALESFVLHMPAALNQHCGCFRAVVLLFVPICLEFVAPSWS
jgi:hypothetical protein